MTTCATLLETGLACGLPAELVHPTAHTSVCFQHAPRRHTCGDIVRVRARNHKGFALERAGEVGIVVALEAASAYVVQFNHTRLVFYDWELECMAQRRALRPRPHAAQPAVTFSMA